MRHEENKVTYKDNIIAQYKFDDPTNIGKDTSGNGNDGVAKGSQLPLVSKIAGKDAITFPGGSSGTSYLNLPSDLLKDISDDTGVTISTWVYFEKAINVWERVFDFGKGATGPYIFMTRNLRGVCSAGEELAVDPVKSYGMGEWIHVAMTVIGTKGGTLSSAGPIIYINGELVADGSISQTSSGAYAKLRHWFKTFEDKENYSDNNIGKSKFDVDPDFCGSVSDFRVYKAGLTEDEVIEVLCESLTDEDIIKLAKDKYLSLETNIITKDIILPSSLMGGKVSVAWKSSDLEVISNTGEVKEIKTPKGVTLTAVLTKGSYVEEKSFSISVLPKDLPPYTLTIEGNNEVVDISKTLYGLFYEDINNAADGGIYAEYIQNRSFESFVFDTYSQASGENGVSTGRVRKPLHAWSGDLDKVIVRNQGGLNEFLSLEDKEINSTYITVSDGATIYNRGFADNNKNCSMLIKKGDKYNFTIWAKAGSEGTITLQLLNKDNESVSDVATVEVEGNNTWKKYGIDTKIFLTGTDSVLGQIALTFKGEISIDMVSLVPENVWGATEEETSKTAHVNYLGNPNYRLRKDLVQTLMDLHPTFLRFPGGCISEGSYIWENVYDWKESVGDVEVRKENFNVWGYVMTMGLGYMEYFQLAEDLNATPLPVMACGVLCQARSDYANPAGGKLRDKYIKNFTDLIDFAISIDFENNQWAALRKKMGHEQPFDLHYLGVGNENWGTEFFANFEIFKVAIDEYMEKNYPGYELYIISTVGAQADDDAYQEGWKFLSGNLTGTAKVSFTDGKTSKEETVSWYNNQKDYMETIADEHYYRSNEYLLNNADRYNYYYRSYNADGSLNDAETSKVFVGEYASTDKNTLAGAVAEAAIMTGFENNSDVVRLAATAPLFNKVLTDGSYRWTPDCIWFDDETVWRTPNYYVQQLFAKYLGTKVLGTSFSTYKNGEALDLIPRGGIEIATGDAEILVRSIKVVSNIDGNVIFEQDFTKELSSAWSVIPGSVGYNIDNEKGLVLKPQKSGLNGLYIINDAWTNYKVEVVATKISGIEGFYVGAGLTEINQDKKDVIEYAIAYNGNSTGVKVYKKGIEAYRLGDYSSSSAAGNLRTSCFEELLNNKEYAITVNYGGTSGKNLICSYTDGESKSKVLDYKLEAYNRDIFNSVTRDEKHVYVKLVNADNIEKVIKLNFKDLSVNEIGKMIILTGDSSIVHVPNVNRKNEEYVTPKEYEVKLTDKSAVLTLPANSVNVLVFEL
ncbi:alpha-L-arabinofuranosidase C-terminal domain-containing protein [Clostridium cellulovorans]|uniref:non-reducing end alpha-L-arabinofuranosidase n=2 Tax=Clostridium cellulovorans TaxID=1493 RepID=D9SQS0_CLOC7|nr:alpha-L-arabinofuranosidase C-terminal domain-containing protein [Clostridium cellulovorans]ADL52276.1 alpha-L-arabinofuranosidase domain protein [Clostridium cellulovorans 743B]BAV13155.1 alpha-arabinofuranosidase [Clostridium cellulovorans]